MLIKKIRMIENMARVLVILAGASVEPVTNVVKNITRTLLVPAGIGVLLINIILCVSILRVGILPVLKFLATIDHGGV